MRTSIAAFFTLTATALSVGQALASTKLYWRQPYSGENYIHDVTEGKVDAINKSSPVPIDWQLVAQGDFNGDGETDLLWRNRNSGQNSLHLRHADEVPSIQTLNQVADFNWKVAAAADFNHDGTDDLLWRNEQNGQNYLYLMENGAIKSKHLINVVAGDWSIAGVSDINLDGNADIVWRNNTTGSNYLYLMNGADIQSSAPLNTVSDTAWQIAAVVDIDADGTADLLYRHKDTGINYVHYLEGDKVVRHGYLSTVGADWDLALAEDLSGDGITDLLWRNPKSGQNYLHELSKNGSKLVKRLNEVGPDWKLVSSWKHHKQDHVPYGDTAVYLRGTLVGTAWAAAEVNQLQYVGHGLYELTLNLGADDYEFKFANVDWSTPNCGSNAPAVVDAATALLLVCGPTSQNITLEIASAGDYTFKLDASNAQAPTLQVQSDDVVIDNEAPVVSVTDLLDSYNVGDLLQLTIDSSDNKQLASAVLAIHDQNDEDVATESWVLSGSSAQNTFSVSLEDWLEGDYGYVVTVSDAAGNSVSAEGAFAVAVGPDTTKPVIQVDGLKASYALDELVQFTLNLSDNDALASVVSQLKNAQGEVLSNFEQTFEEMQQSGLAMEFENPGVAGNFTVETVLIDASGNEQTDIQTFSVVEDADTTKPALTQTGFALSYVQGATISYAVSATDNKGLASLSIELIDTDNKTVYSNNWTLTGTADDVSDEIQTASLPVGGYAYVIRVTDLAGNLEQLSASVQVLDAPDTTKPQITVSGINASYTQGSVISYNVQASDNKQLASLFVEVQNSAAQSVYRNDRTTDGDTVIANETMADSASWAVGQYSYQYGATDASGNQSTGSGSFVIEQAPDTTKPTATVAGFAATYTEGDTASFTVSATDETALASMTLEISNGLYSKTWPVTGTSASQNGSVALATAGTYSYTLTTQDAAGNTQTKTGSFVVEKAPDTTKPTATVTGFATTYTEGDTANFTVSATDETALASMTLVIDGGVYSNTWTATGTSASESGSVTLATAGTYGYTLTALDAAGNTQTAMGSFTVESGIDAAPIYTAKCAACHDSGLAGAPILGNPDGWDSSDQNLNDAITNGKAPFMPGFSSQLSAAEIQALVAYIRQQNGQ